MSPRLQDRTGLIPLQQGQYLHGPPVAIPAAEVLASLLDLRGSVDLADILAARPPIEAPEVPRFADTRRGAGVATLRSTCEQTVRSRLAEIETRMARRFASPFEDRPRIPDAKAMHAALSDAYGGDFKLVVSTLSAAFRERLVSSVERVFAEVAQLREDISADLRNLGPVSMRLEALDRGLYDATERAVSRLIERLAAAMERDVFRDLSRAVKMLPEGAALASASGLDRVADWFAEGGWVLARVDRIEAVTRTLFAHERAVLEALVAPPRREDA